MRKKKRIKVETQQEWACLHKHNTCFVNVWPKHNRSLVVSYKYVHVDVGYAKQNKPI